MTPHKCIFLPTAQPLPVGRGARAAVARRPHRHGQLRGGYPREDPEVHAAEPRRHRESAQVHDAEVPRRAHGQELQATLQARGAPMPPLDHHNALRIASSAKRKRIRAVRFTCTRRKITTKFAIVAHAYKLTRNRSYSLAKWKMVNE